MRRLLAFLLLAMPLLAADCPTGAASADHIPPGDWGGEHVLLTVEAEGASLEFDCATGRITEAPRVGADGRFSLDGVFVRGHGGPVRVGEPADEHPARYAGTLRGDRVTFTVTTLDDGQTVGSFEARRGVSARVFKCL